MTFAQMFRAMALALLVLAMPVAARAQVDTREGIYLQNQIQELKRDIQGLRDQLRSGAAGSSSLGAARPSAPPPTGDITTALLERVSRLEDEVRQLRGRADEEANERKRTDDDLAKQIEDLNFKIDNSQGKPATPSTSKPGAPPPAAPNVIAPTPAPAGKRTVDAAMQEGNAALARRDYAAAETAAREVIAAPKSPKAYDGQFLLAQALNGKKDFQGAAVAYDDTYNRARTGAHAQDSLLGLANALTNIGEKRAACATLDKLRAEFPTQRTDLKDGIAAARQKAACR